MKNQKRVYFAGKFNLLKDKNKTLSERLVNDYRSIILGSSEKLTLAKEGTYTTKGIEYMGPFYCEQASNGDYTSTDCNIVLENEYKSVSNSEVYLVVFDEDFSVGSVVELSWALEQDKEIIIFYKEEAKGNYTIQSDYWFAIANALHQSNKVKVFSFNSIQEVIDKIIKGEIFNDT